MSNIIKKEEAYKLIDQLPSNATWDDLMYKIYVREAIEKGLEDSNTGKTTEVKYVRGEYGLSE